MHTQTRIYSPVKLQYFGMLQISAKKFDFWSLLCPHGKGTVGCETCKLRARTRRRWHAAGALVAQNTQKKQLIVNIDSMMYPSLSKSLKANMGVSRKYSRYWTSFERTTWRSSRPRTECESMKQWGIFWQKTSRSRQWATVPNAPDFAAVCTAFLGLFFRLRKRRV